MRTTTLDLAELHQRMEEAIAWYLYKAPIANPESDLRTDALAPSEDLTRPTEKVWADFDFPRPWTDEMRREYNRALAQAIQMRQTIVDEVARKRRAALRDVPPVDFTQIDALVDDGRLLIYFPDENLCDGAAPAASDGFFDENNIPPWDTWLMYVIEKGRWGKNYLIAWVPPELLELATAGVDVNPEECILWAEAMPETFVLYLQSSGLLRKASAQARDSRQRDD